MSLRLRVERPGLPRGIVAIPVRTPIVQPGDDLSAIVVRCVAGLARIGDVMAVSETAVAIAQNQAIRAEHIRPSKLAYALAQRAGPLATVNQPESLQLVIDRVGAWRVVAAAGAHVVGRLAGRRGVFYTMMGEAITAMDGYTGTMPPFERTIVFAPQDPNGFAQSVKERTGIDCAVADANDLQKAKVLGATAGVRTDVVAAALLSNPAGNGDEQTPIVVLKWRGEGANPLIQAAVS